MLFLAVDLTKDDEKSPWRVVKGSFQSVSVLSTPALSELAPLGMSKYSHLSDGTLDLVLVRQCEKKDFERYLKRHGNTKNQVTLEKHTFQTFNNK